MSKELWFAEMVRIQAELEDEGHSPAAAYKKAGDLAYGAMQDRLADVADALRKRAKGE